MKQLIQHELLASYRIYKRLAQRNAVWHGVFSGFEVVLRSLRKQPGFCSAVGQSNP